MTLYHGISLILLSFLILIVGMFKPKWILFWMDAPMRMMVIAIAMVVFMGGSMLYGEGLKDKKQALEKQQALKARAALVQPSKEAASAAVEKPKPKHELPVAPPAPMPAPATPANELRP